MNQPVLFTPYGASPWFEPGPPPSYWGWGPSWDEVYPGHGASFAGASFAGSPRSKPEPESSSGWPIAMIALTIAGGALAIFAIAKLTKAAEPFHEKMGGAAAKILAARYGGVGGKVGALKGALKDRDRDREAWLPPVPSSEKYSERRAVIGGVPLLLPHEEKR